MKRAAAFLLVLLTLAGFATADYVQVRRPVTIKAQPQSGAAVLAQPEVGTNLVLAEPGQTNGYYHVRIPPGLGSGSLTGFVYRNRVRGFPGDPPGTQVASVVAVTSDVVYQGIPTNEFPEFPITVLDHEYFVVGYSEDFLNPAWVFYHIGAATDFRSFQRPGFRVDQETAARVRTQDYNNSGFDRGHMAPNFALGSRFGADGARSTFVMSNVSPQFHAFNDGQWGDLEEWVAGRKPPNATVANFIQGWADVFGGVWVVVGPLFEEERDPLESGVPVPSAFFCIVVDEQDSGVPRALAFILPHENRREHDLTQFLASVDEVESRAGLDFFPLLPDTVEDSMEQTTPTALWDLPVAPN